MEQTARTGELALSSIVDQVLEEIPWVSDSSANTADKSSEGACA